MEAGGGASGLLLGVVANPGMVVGLDVGKPPRMFGFMLDVSILFTHYGTTVLLRWWRRVWFFDRLVWVVRQLVVRNFLEGWTMMPLWQKCKMPSPSTSLLFP